MAIERKESRVIFSATAGCTVQFNCKGELRYCIYSQQLRFSQHSVGCVGLRVTMRVGITHCDTAHWRKVKNLICVDFLWLCGGCSITVITNAVARLLVSDLQFLKTCRAFTCYSSREKLQMFQKTKYLCFFLWCFDENLTAKTCYR